MRQFCLAIAAFVALCGACAAPHHSSVPAASPRRTCFILRDLRGGPSVRKGDACAAALTPASTFKIPHALIALETKARSGPDDAETWDGQQRSIAAWNRDHTLATALRHSVVWYFQRTASRIGKERMSEQLHLLHYGNERIGEELTTFWLDGSLRISADQQADFMEAFARRSLPMSAQNMAAVDEMMLQVPGTIMRGGDPLSVAVTWEPSTRVFAKTGSGDGAEGNVRWLVGHIEEAPGTPAAKSWAFVSMVTAKEPLGAEAVTQATDELAKAGVLKTKAPPQSPPR